MPKSFILLGLLCSIITSTFANAKNQRQLSIDGYQGSGDVTGYRLGFVPISYDLSQIFSNCSFCVNSEVSMEIAVANWRHSERDETVSSLIFKPTFRQIFWEGDKYSLFWEAGIGIAFHDADIIERRWFGSHFNFEDHLGIGFTLNQSHHIGFRYFHYSNANLHHPNTGIDFMGINYRYVF